MHTIIKATLLVCALSLPFSSAMARNPFDYSHWENAIRDAKWQLDVQDNDICEQAECESYLDTYDDYQWANSGSDLRFSTNGDKDEGWRNEWRFLANFSRGATRTMTARIRFINARTDSDGFTVAQLHYEGGNGPPARLEVLDEEDFEVTFRNNESCSSNCWTQRSFTANPRSLQDVQLRTSNGNINVTVAGQTRTWDLKREWPNQSNYYWKAGVYLQEDGEVEVQYATLFW